MITTNILEIRTITKNYMKQEKEYFIDNSTVRIRSGRVLESYAEVLVNSCDTMISMDCGVSRAIKKMK